MENTGGSRGEADFMSDELRDKSMETNAEELSDEELEAVNGGYIYYDDFDRRLKKEELEERRLKSESLKLTKVASRILLPPT